MKIAYLLNWELNSQDGVSKKVYDQTHNWLSAGHDVKVFCVLKNTITNFGQVPFCLVREENASNIIRKYWSTFNAYQSMLSHLKEFNPDVIYFRFDIYQPALKSILQSFPTIIEINSNDIDELRLIGQRNIKGKILFYYHLLVRNSYFKMVSGFCCVTNEIARLPSIRKFNKPIFVIPNALNSGDYTCPMPDAVPRGLLPKLVFIGSPKQAWHGLDKLLELARRTIGQLQFDIIGTGGSEFKNIPINVTFHGFLKKDKYEAIVCASNIGICTLALHRNNMQEASPLKTREYLAYGLPIILGYEDTAFIGLKLPDWALQLPNNETNVANNIDSIVSFCYKYRNLRISKAEIFNFIDSSVWEVRRLSYLEQISPTENQIINLSS